MELRYERAKLVIADVGMTATTLSGLLLDRALASPGIVAVRQRRLGIWQPITWSGLRDDAARIGNGLAAKGVGPGDVVAIVGDDCLELLAAEHAIIGLGAVALLLPPDYSPETTAALAHGQGAKVILAGDQEQYDKFVEGPLPPPELVIVIATRGLRDLEVANRTDRSTRCTLVQLIDDAGSVSTWNSSAALRTPDETAIRFTEISGHEVVVHASTHAELLAGAASTVETLRLTTGSSLLAQRSLSEAQEQVLCVAAPVLTGATVVFGEGGVLGGAEVAQVQPTHLRPSGHWLAGIAADAAKRAEETTGLKKLLLGGGLPKATAQNIVRQPTTLSSTRAIGVAMSAIAFGFLLVSTGLNDWLRLLILGLLAGVSAVLVARIPGAIAVPIRRRYGLGRIQAIVLSESLPLAGTDFMSRLGVPMVALEPMRSKELTRMVSPLLTLRTGAPA